MIVSTIAALLVAMGAAYGQQKDAEERTQTYQEANEGMVIIDKNEIPASLRETLQDEKYAGWENGTVYQNTSTGEYVIAPRAFRFDQNGNEIEMSDAASNYGYRSGSEVEDAASDQRSGDARSRRSGQDDAQGAGTQTQPGQSGREQYSTDDLTEVQAEQVPEALRRTLRQDPYRGWQENGTLYQDPSTGEYVLVMEEDSRAGRQRTYRFDTNGEPQKTGASSSGRNR